MVLSGQFASQLQNKCQPFCGEMVSQFPQRQQSRLISLKNLSFRKQNYANGGGNLGYYFNSRHERRHGMQCSAVADAPSLSPAARSDKRAALNIEHLTPKQFPAGYYDSSGRLMLKCLTLPELEEWCGSIGEEPVNRAIQIWRWMYYDRKWIRSLDDAPAGQVTNGFSAGFRDKVRPLATLDGGLEVVSMHIASDGTRKIVFRLTSGPGVGGQVETVLIPIVREAGAKERVTLCVSSQVGCAMACQFCYTGRMGLLGNLTAGQIVEQVVVARRLLFEEDSAKGVERHVTPITNIVYMGLGEPMDNLDAVLPSIDIVTQPMGLHFSYNKVCVSTVGLVPQMKKFVDSTKAVLAVSLHAATDEVRDSIVPVNKRYPLAELVGTLEELCPKDRSAPRHGYTVFIEYTMLRGVNDRPEDAKALIHLLRNVRCKINLIVFNPHEGTPFERSTPEAVYAFRDVLIKGGLVATVRSSRGDDQMAACGQLGNPELSPKRPPLLYKKKD